MKKQAFPIALLFASGTLCRAAVPLLSVGYADVDGGDFTALLAWPTDAATITVERKDGASGAWTAVATFSDGTASFNDTTVRLGKTYFYRLSDSSSTGAEIEYHLLRRLETGGYPIFSDGVYNTASWCQPPQNGFDGNLDSYVDSDQNLWPKVGVDFGAATNFVALVRAYPRLRYAGRFNGFKAYGGSDWTDNSKCKALTDAVNSSAGERWYVLPADFSTAYRYYFYSDCYGGNCAECEFYGWSQADIDANSMSDVELTVTRSDWTDSHAVLSWDASAGSATVQRREGEDGNWVTLQSGVSTGSYTDTSLKFGVVSYYRLVIDGAYSNYASLLRMRKLAVTADKAFIQGSGRAANAFDGDTATFSASDVANACLGADFGRVDTAVALVRVLPREGYAAQASGLSFSGSQRKRAVVVAGASADTCIVADAGSPAGSGWIECETGSTDYYRSFYVRGGSFHAMAAEVEFYGWTMADQGKAYSAPQAGFKVADHVPEGSTARPDFTPLFTWNGAATDDSADVKIQYAKSVDGHWRAFADVAGADSHLGLDAPIGVLAYYRLVVDGVPASGSAVSYRRLRELDPNAYTMFNQGNGDQWGHHTIDLAFDGDISTFVDINYKDQRLEDILIAQGKVKGAWDGYNDETLAVPKMGADFGEPTNTVATVCLFPRDMNNLGRMLKARVYASDNDAATEVATDEPATMISGDTNLESLGVNYHRIDIPAPTAYRTYYLDEIRYGDVSEIVFYGRSERDLKGPETLVVLLR